MDWMGDDCMGPDNFWRFSEGATLSISCWAPAQCTRNISALVCTARGPSKPHTPVSALSLTWDTRQ